MSRHENRAAKKDVRKKVGYGRGRRQKDVKRKIRQDMKEEYTKWIQKCRESVQEKLENTGGVRG